MSLSQAKRGSRLKVGAKIFVSGCQKPSKINTVGKKNVIQLDNTSDCLKIIVNIYPINAECNAGSRVVSFYHMIEIVDGIPLSCIPVICGYYTVARHIDQNSGCSEFGGNFATDLRRARIELTDCVV